MMSACIRAAILLFCALMPCVAGAEDYIIGHNDVLKVTVYDHDDLASVVRVGGNGSITIPLIGQVRVSGLTVAGVENLLKEKLADGYIINPLVTVFIQEYRSRKVTILGEIVRPGLYELTGDSTLLEIISKAGGLNEDAGERAIIKRHPAGKAGEDLRPDTVTLTIDLGRLVAEGDNSLNTSVYDGDSIYIPKAGYFFVTGEVDKPGSYKYQDGMTVLKAITTARGFTAKAARSKVRLIRRINGADTTTRVEMNEKVLPDDVVDVPASFF